MREREGEGASECKREKERESVGERAIMEKANTSAIYYHVDLTWVSTPSYETV